MGFNYRRSVFQYIGCCLGNREAYLSACIRNCLDNAGSDTFCCLSFVWVEITFVMASHPVICSPAIFVVVSTGSGADEPESEESLLVSPADGAVVGVTGAGAGVGVTGAGAGVGVTDGFSESSDVVPGVLKT